MRLRDISQTKSALGGDITLGIITALSDKATNDLFATLWSQVYQFEKQFSRFLPMSELSVLNRSAGLKTPISSAFRDLLTAAKTMGIQTAGLYNPFILPALQRAGYVASAATGYEGDAQEDYSNKQVVGIERLTIGDDWATIPYGTALDMGGCGKGYLADQLGRELQQSPVQGYWLSLGGDVATMGQDENGTNLTLTIQNANQLDGILDWIIISPTTPAAVATSGTFKRKGQDGERGWHHIIDPSTLRPALTDVRLATVCANSVLEADVLASCAVILGSQKAPTFLKQRGITAALLQCIDQQGKPFVRQFGSIITKQPLRKIARVISHG